MFTLSSTAVYIIFGLFIFFHHVEYHNMYVAYYCLCLCVYWYLTLPFHFSYSLTVLASLFFISSQSIRIAFWDNATCNHQTILFCAIFQFRALLFDEVFFFFYGQKRTSSEQAEEKNVLDFLDNFRGHQTKISFILPKLCSTTTFGRVCLCESKCVIWISLIRFNNNDDFSFETFSSTVRLVEMNLCVCVHLFLHI